MSYKLIGQYESWFALQRFRVSRIKTGPPLQVGNDEYLQCPFCGGSCTHLDAVSCGYHTSYDNGSSPVATATMRGTVGQLVSGAYTDLDYSERRHWIELHIDCETCDGGSVVFAQHKGSTEVYLVPNAVPVSARLTRA